MRRPLPRLLHAPSPLLPTPSITDPLTSTHPHPFCIRQTLTEPHVRLVLADSFPMPLLFLCSTCASNRALNAAKCIRIIVLRCFGCQEARNLLLVVSSIATDPSHGNSIRQGCEVAPGPNHIVHSTSATPDCAIRPCHLAHIIPYGSDVEYREPRP